MNQLIEQANELIQKVEAWQRKTVQKNAELLLAGEDPCYWEPASNEIEADYKDFKENCDSVGIDLEDDAAYPYISFETLLFYPSDCEKIFSLEENSIHMNWDKWREILLNLISAEN